MLHVLKVVQLHLTLGQQVLVRYAAYIEVPVLVALDLSLDQVRQHGATHFLVLLEALNYQLARAAQFDDGRAIEERQKLDPQDRVVVLEET